MLRRIKPFVSVCHAALAWLLVATGLPVVVRALHPVNALLIFWTTCQVAKHSWRYVRGTRAQQKAA